MSENFRKSIISRTRVDVVEMEHMYIGKNKNEKANGKKRIVTEREKDAHYMRRQKAKAEDVKRLMEINFENFRSTFVTLTFSKQPADLKEANKCIRNFIRFLKKRYYDLRYLAVVESNDYGNFHYHLVLNVVYDTMLEKDIRKAWKHGIEVEIKEVYDIEGLAGYITKQFTKRDGVLYGKKRCLHSKELQDAIVVKSWDADIELQNYVKTELKEEVPVSYYFCKNENAGVVRYASYDKKIDFFDSYVVARRIN